MPSPAIVLDSALSFGPLVGPLSLALSGLFLGVSVSSFFPYGSKREMERSQEKLSVGKGSLLQSFTPPPSISPLPLLGLGPRTLCWASSLVRDYISLFWA